VQRIVGIVRQLSFLNINSRLHRTPCQLGDLLQGAIERFRHESGVSPPVAVENPLGDLAIDTHVEMFEDAVGKILLNAWEAYGERPAAERRICLRTELVGEPSSRSLRLSIEDAGRGIDPEVSDQLFEPFISTKRTVGVGMGLTVARHALRNLGGDVTIQNRPGGGAIAVLLHPLEKRRTQEDDSRAPFAMQPPAG